MINNPIHPIDYQLLEPTNEWYPLPKDYPTLTPSGQKEARLATLMKQDTYMDVVAAWDLFRRLYLMTTEPGFCYHDFMPSPPFHYEILYDLARYPLNLLAAPRGFAKSTIVSMEVPLFLLLTRPHYRIILSFATDRLVEAQFDAIIRQITENPFILADFGVQKPLRGRAIWNRHHIRLINGSKMQGFSVTGRKRGARPDLFLLDDPEFDPESETSSQLMKERFETFLFRQVIPMLERGSAAFWVGTIITRRSFLYHACYSDDPRFKFWNRKVLIAIKKDLEHNKTNLLWDGKWSEEVLEHRRLQIGNAAFSGEYLNDPTSSEERVLKIDPIKNEYNIEERIGPNPLESNAIVEYHKFDKESKEWVKVTVPFRELLTKMFRIITFDPSKGLTQHHDYSCAATLGFDKDNCLWILDMWMGRAKESVLLNTLYKLGLKWVPKVLGIESTSMQIQLVDAMSTFLDVRRTDMWKPKVVPINYRNIKGHKAKPDRISMLEWRFETGKIKYPAHLTKKWPISALYAQTRDFTYDLALLPFDDALDAVAMGPAMIHNRGVKEAASVQEPTLQDRFRSGQTTIGGVPLISGFDANELDADTLDAILDKPYLGSYNDNQEGRIIKPPYIVRRPNVINRR